MGKQKGRSRLVVPKTKCCVSKDRCSRCPIRMLKEGTLPDGLAVKKRVLVDAGSGKRVKKLSKDEVRKRARVARKAA